MDIDEDIDLLMSSDLIYPQMITKSISFTRTQAGWFFARSNKTEKVGDFEADFYNINGLTIETKKRREHLSEDDVKTNKALFDTLKKTLDASNHPQKSITRKINSKSSDSLDEIDDCQSTMKNELTNGDSLQPIRVEDEIVINGDEDDEDDSIMDVKAAIVSSTNGLIKRRKSLPPPLKQNISWSEYINAPKGNPPCLGRPWKTKDSNRTFKATIAMSQDFPLTIESLLNILEVITQFKHFKKLKEFVNLNLPPGFPVKIDIPLIPTILARVTFLNFNYLDDADENLFVIPEDYTEDPNRFPEL
ncbi:GPCR-chaperone-like protein [Sarcoptes scabiei]|nr:GPCR-chaperone-like protein [Sarcoptes scabiei]